MFTSALLMSAKTSLCFRGVLFLFLFCFEGFESLFWLPQISLLMLWHELRHAFILFLDIFLLGLLSESSSFQLPVFSSVVVPVRERETESPEKTEPVGKYTCISRSWLMWLWGLGSLKSVVQASSLENLRQELMLQSWDRISSSLGKPPFCS